nr:phosphatidylserine decarboxylase proenzyme 2-like [Ipomoea batatas]
MQSTLFFMPLKIRDGEDGMLLNPLALSDLAASTLFLGCSLYGAGFRFMKQFLSQVAFNISSSLVFVHQQRNAIAVLHCTVAVQNRPQAPKVFNSVSVCLLHWILIYAGIVKLMACLLMDVLILMQNASSRKWKILILSQCAINVPVYHGSNLKVVDKRVRLAELVLCKAALSVYNRRKKRLVEVIHDGKIVLSMRAIYQSKFGLGLKDTGAKEILQNISESQGKKMDTLDSAKDIPKFVELFKYPSHSGND